MFDGIGTEIVGRIIGLIITAVIGGVVVYKVRVKNTTKQIQKASDNSKQEQEISIDIDDNNNRKIHSKNKTTIKQLQKAGNNASQFQIGDLNNGKKTKAKGWD